MQSSNWLFCVSQGVRKEMHTITGTRSRSKIFWISSGSPPLPINQIFFNCVGFFRKNTVGAPSWGILEIPWQLNKVNSPPVAEWVARLCAEREIIHSNPVILPLLKDTYRIRNGPTMPAVKRSVGVASKVNLRSSVQARKHASDIYPGFEAQARHHQKSKTGVSVAPKKGHVSSKFLK